MVTHSLTMLEKHLVFTGESPPRNFTTNRVKKRSIKSEDPMSHRIIEKRRRDRMNNCLADLSRLIPPEYLKKGRGRIEKTEIIEMAIKHIGHLQNIITSTRFNENSNGSVPSPPATAMLSRDPPSFSSGQTITAKHYKMGYLECMSEAMHFLVEVQGYFAGDSLCVQMINHLRKHCDKILKGNALNFSKKHTEETTSSDSSASPINYHGSPPLRISNSTGSVSDDNQSNAALEVRTFDGYCSPKRYPDLNCGSKRNGDVYYPKPAELDVVDSENRSDSESHQYVLKFRNGECEKDELYYDSVGKNLRNFLPPSTHERCGSYENSPVKDENGPSQLREILTSPTPLNNYVNGQTNHNVSELKGNISPRLPASGVEMSQSQNNNFKPSLTSSNKNYKSADSAEANSDLQEGDNHHIMYKFKNNIKQRFSKEKRESAENDLEGDQLPSKKLKPIEVQKHSDLLMKERLIYADRREEEVEDKKYYKFNGDCDTRRRVCYNQDPEMQDDDLANRLNFSCNGSDKLKRWEEPRFHFQNGQKLWALTPNASMPFYSSPTVCKPPKRPLPEFPSSMNNSFHHFSGSSPEPGYEIPIFALHSKGSFYIPLTLDHATLAPFLAILGITKNDENVEEKTVLHPVTISVNFQSHLVR